MRSKYHVLFLLFLIFSISSSYANEKKYHFKISKKEYRFSTFFEIDSEDSFRGNIKKSVFRLRTCYDLSDIHGWQATGIVRVLSLGAIYTWAKEIDVYDDTRGEYIGMIDGQVVTTAAARFSLYDAKNDLVGIAFLDNNYSGFTISDPSSEAYTIARLKRNYIRDDVDNWEVTVYEGERIDPRILRIFSAFAVDYQNAFKKDK